MIRTLFTSLPSFDTEQLTAAGKSINSLRRVPGLRHAFESLLRVGSSRTRASESLLHV